MIINVEESTLYLALVRSANVAKAHQAAIDILVCFLDSSFFFLPLFICVCPLIYSQTPIPVFPPAPAPPLPI